MILKKFKLKKWVKITILILLLLIFAFSVYKIVIYIIDSKKIGDINEEILELPSAEIEGTENAEIINPPKEETSDYWTFIKTPYIDVNFDELLKKNKDTVAWIKINNTNVNYPIVQSSDNTKYLKKAFDGTYNKAGWLFMDYRNNSKDFGVNTIIYGHSMKNTTMFGTLLKAKEASWYKNKDNWVIKVSTPEYYTLWQIFSLYTVDPENYYITTNFNNETQINKFINTITSRSIYNFNAEVNKDDKILTLSTCSSSSGKNRFVVHAKLIKRETR